MPDFFIWPGLGDEKQGENGVLAPLKAYPPESAAGSRACGARSRCISAGGVEGIAGHGLV
jgi:hypothetical protein